VDRSFFASRTPKTDAPVHLAHLKPLFSLLPPIYLMFWFCIYTFTFFFYSYYIEVYQVGQVYFWRSDAISGGPLCGPLFSKWTMKRPFEAILILGVLTEIVYWKYKTLIVQSVYNLVLFSGFFFDSKGWPGNGLRYPTNGL